MGPILIIIAVLLVIAKHDKSKKRRKRTLWANPIGRKLVMMVASSLVGNYASKYTFGLFQGDFSNSFLARKNKNTYLCS